MINTPQFHSEPSRITHQHLISLHWIDLKTPRATGFTEEILSPDEITRAQAYRHETSQEMFIQCRTTLRNALSQAYAKELSLSIPPHQWVFEQTPTGKPRLAIQSFERGTTPRLEFNVSHSGDLGVIAIAKQAVGIDIERLDRVTDPLSLATRFFHPIEAEWLASSPKNLQSYRFLKLWTFKEALLKATGEGIAEKLNALNLIPFEAYFEGSVFSMNLPQQYLCQSILTPDGWMGALAIEN